MSDPLLHLLLRITARISIALFLPGFAGSALSKLWPAHPAAAWLGSNAQRFILAFAASHTLHLALIIYGGVALPSFRTILIPPVVIGGSTVYLFIYIAAFFALQRIRGRAPGRAASRLESVALYAIWFVFSFVSAAKLVELPSLYGVYSAALVFALIVRVMAARRKPALAISPV